MLRFLHSNYVNLFLGMLSIKCNYNYINIFKIKPEKAVIYQPRATPWGYDFKQLLALKGRNKHTNIYQINLFHPRRYYDEINNVHIV